MTLQSPAIIIHTIMIGRLSNPNSRKHQINFLTGGRVAIWYRRWIIFWSILHSFNRRAELMRLVDWAEKRRLVGPLSHYKSRLEDEELRLIRYSFRDPEIKRWAHVLHFLSSRISPKPKYFPRGSASHLRSLNGKS